MAKVVLLENISIISKESFEQFGIKDVSIHKYSIDSATSDVFDANILGIRSRSKITPEVLKKFKNLSAIGCFCIGTDQVSLDSAKMLGIPVFNAPFSNTRSVAELVIAEIITLFRQLHINNIQMHQGIWNKNADGCYEIKGKTLGIVGYGNIGAQVGIIAESLGMSVLYYDIENKLPFGSNKQVNSIDELLNKSHIVTLHIPQDSTTKNIINKNTIAKMRKGAFLVNASRGNVVDIDALCEALESKHIVGVAIDVFPSEPSNNNEEFISPLRKFENALLTPHIGGSTQEAQVNIALEVSNKLANYYVTGSTAMSVNYPNLSIQKKHNQSIRISHTHKNIPGVLQAINAEMAKYGINIKSQVLSTDDDIGYVLLDVNISELPANLVDGLKSVNGTISVKIL